MRKLLVMTAAGLALALVAPLAASAAPVVQGEVIKAAADSIGTVDEVRHRRWHRRLMSGGGHSRWESRRLRRLR